MLLLACRGVLGADEAVFVEKGKAVAIRQVGAKWEEKDGALVRGGENNYLVAGKAVGEGDFTIRARVSLDQPPFPRTPVRPPALSTAFTPKAIS